MVDLEKSMFGLVCDFNNKYVRAGVTSQAKLAAVSDRRSTWETFRIKQLPGEEIWIQSAYTGNWVQTLSDSSRTLAAVPGRPDNFDLVDLGSGKFALKQGSDFVRAGVGRECYLGACSPHQDRWETFRFEANTMGELETVDWCYSINSHTPPTVTIEFWATVKNAGPFIWTNNQIGLTTGTMIAGWGEIWQFNDFEVDSFAGLDSGRTSRRLIGTVPWFPYEAGNEKLVQYVVTYDFTHPADIDKGNNGISFAVTNKEIEEGARVANQCSLMPTP